MNYALIRKCDIANGDGVRVSLFVSGCTHKCPGCFNPDQWNFDYGDKFTAKTEEEIFEAMAPNHISGLSILGGEPMEPENQAELTPFLRRLRERFGKSKTVWVYTGCVLERDLLADTRWHTNDTEKMLGYINVLVDGPFIEALKDISLKFRGSSNQRIIDMSQIPPLPKSSASSSS